MAIENHPAVRRIIRLALEEDLGPKDVTTDAVVDSTWKGEAILLAKERLVLAGLPVFKQVFLEISHDVCFEDYFNDGDLVEEGERVCLLQGPLSALLGAERTALNFLQRMSGIATLTRHYVENVGYRKVRILDTRKTAPGLRRLDKYSVSMGGGYNHRFGLYDGVLIKDNHIAAAGSITEAVKRAKARVPHTLKIEVEVEDIAGIQEAVKAGADVILLDNMSTAEIKKAVKLVEGRVMLEASGGIQLDRVREIAATGVNFISIGALTHSAKAADFSLEVMTRKSSN